MRNSILAYVVAVVLAFAIAPADASRQTTQVINHPGTNTVEVRTPIYVEECRNESRSNLGNAALGAGVGYAGARAMTSGRNANRWGLGAAAVGALVGSQLEKNYTRVCDDVLTGWEVQKIINGRQQAKTFEAVTK